MPDLVERERVMRESLVSAHAAWADATARVGDYMTALSLRQWEAAEAFRLEAMAHVEASLDRVTEAARTLADLR